MAAELLAIRHAEATVRGVCYGQAKVRLALSHEEAALRMREALDTRRIRTVWSSDLPRCREPARRLAILLGARFRVSQSIREMSMGLWEERAWVDLEREDSTRYARWMSHWRTEAPPGGEAIAELESRVRRWNDALSDEPTLLVAHAGVIRCLRVVRSGARWEDVMSKTIPHLTLLRL